MAPVEVIDAAGEPAPLMIGVICERVTMRG
jgi:hypothetical protein